MRLQTLIHKVHKVSITNVENNNLSNGLNQQLVAYQLLAIIYKITACMPIYITDEAQSERKRRLK